MSQNQGPFSEKALCRARIVWIVLAYVGHGMGKSGAVRLVADMEHDWVDGTSKRVSRRTIYRWLKRYGDGGIAALDDESRQSCEDSEVLDEDLLEFLRDERGRDREASIPELIERAREHDVITHKEPICRQTVWRAMRRMDLSTRRCPASAPMRRYEQPMRLHTLLVDFVHFRAGAKGLKRCAIYFLDDCTRYGVEVTVTTSERADVMLETLYRVFIRVGKFDCLYLDRGSAFIANALASVCARLGIPLIHGKARYPEGRGKIERFNRTLKARSLRGLRREDIDADCRALTLLLRHDLHEVYNHKPHSSLDDETPWERWHESDRRLRPMGDEQSLQRAFVLELQRTVSKDNVVSIDGTEYEMPVGYDGDRVTIERALLEKETFYFHHDDERIRLHPLDAVFNSQRPQRSRSGQDRDDEEQTPPKSASMLKFERTYGSILDDDGGFPDTTDSTNNEG